MAAEAIPIASAIIGGGATVLSAKKTARSNKDASIRAAEIAAESNTPAPLPDGDNVRASRRRSFAQSQRRSGRSSTVLAPTTKLG